jgi:hypothetical protein
MNLILYAPSLKHRAGRAGKRFGDQQRRHRMIPVPYPCPIRETAGRNRNTVSNPGSTFITRGLTIMAGCFSPDLVAHMNKLRLLHVLLIYLRTLLSTVFFICSCKVFHQLAYHDILLSRQSTNRLIALSIPALSFPFHPHLYPMRSQLYHPRFVSRYFQAIH